MIYDVTSQVPCPKTNPRDGQMCEICDDPRACWEGHQPCGLSGEIRDPTTGGYATPEAWDDPCLGQIGIEGWKFYVT